MNRINYVTLHLKRTEDQFEVDSIDIDKDRSEEDNTPFSELSNTSKDSTFKYSAFETRFGTMVEIGLSERCPMYNFSLVWDEYSERGLTNAETSDAIADLFISYLFSQGLDSIE